MSPHCSFRVPVRKRADHTQGPADQALERLGRRLVARCPLGEALREALDDPVLGAAGGEPDRVRDRAPARVAVRDHGQPAQAEQVRAAVGVRVEARAQPPRGRPDQQPAELARASSRRSPRAAGRAARRSSPSSSFSAMLPVKPSVTRRRRRRAAGRGPRRCRRSRSRRASRSSACASSVSWLPFSGSSPIESRRTVGSRDAEDLRGEDRAHDAELEQVLGPAVGVRAGVDQHARRPSRVGIGTAIAGRSTPGSRRRWSRPAASIAPVFPAETTASASPSATARTAATSDESGFAAHGLGRLLGHLDHGPARRRARGRPCRGPAGP